MGIQNISGTSLLHPVVAIALFACAIANPLVAGPARAASPSAEVRAELAPGGQLRAAINFGNPVLAQRDAAGGEPRGVSVAIAREMARRLNVQLAPVLYNSAGAVSRGAALNEWDLAFLAIDPERAVEIEFSPPYVIIEGGYMVRNASALHRIDEVDRPGNRIMVGAGSVYDLYLSRSIRAAQIVRAPSSPEAITMYLMSNAEVVAGVRQALSAFARTHPEVRLIPGSFMTIQQAMGTPKGRERAAAYVRDVVSELKASGFVARELTASGQTEASVAP